MIRRYAAAIGGSLLLHLLMVAVVVWAIVPVRMTPPGRAGLTPARTITTFIVSPTEDSTFLGLKPVDRSLPLEQLSRDDESPELRIGDLRIDLDRIGARAQVLFPFLTPGLSLDVFLNTPQDPSLHLLNPVPGIRSSREKQPAPPLMLDDRALQSLVDRSWARRERWAAFDPVRRAVETHDADEGRVPALLQRYVDQNSLQPYADVTSRDPRLWAQLGLAADHVLFIGFIRQYASEHPSTRATTELLFLLDKVAEANGDALSVLMDSDPRSRLGWTRATSPKAYYLITEVRRHYRDELARRGGTSDEAIAFHYERVRLAILNGIVRTTPNGYRANDARFLIGAIYWRQGRREAALRAWSAIAPNEGDSHATVNADLVAALRRYGIGPATPGRAPLDPALFVEIEHLLRSERGRWVTFSGDRLRQFGYRFDTF